VNRTLRRGRRETQRAAEVIASFDRVCVIVAGSETHTQGEPNWQQKI
jgi:hypothetical protein